MIANDFAFLGLAQAPMDRAALRRALQLQREQEKRARQQAGVGRIFQWVKDNAVLAGGIGALVVVGGIVIIRRRRRAAA